MCALTSLSLLAKGAYIIIVSLIFFSLCKTRLLPPTWEGVLTSHSMGRSFACCTAWNGKPRQGNTLWDAEGTSSRQNSPVEVGTLPKTNIFAPKNGWLEY